MSLATLTELLRMQFPDADISGVTEESGPGAFAQWDSLGHYNFLLLVEESYGVRFEMDELGEMKTLNSIKSALKNHGVDL